jgi:hypothetical protein
MRGFAKLAIPLHTQRVVFRFSNQDGRGQQDSDRHDGNGAYRDASLDR